MPSNTFDRFFEELKVKGSELADKIKELLHEGNVRRIIVKDERGHTFMEIPLTVATIGVIAAPLLGYLGVKRDWSDMAAKAVAAAKSKAKT